MSKAAAKTPGNEPEELFTEEEEKIAQEIEKMPLEDIPYEI